MIAPQPISMAMIYPSDAGRAVIKGHVALLAESLTALGLKSPITVRPAIRVRDGVDAEVFEIVAGRHRFEAAKSLNWKEIDAYVMNGEADDAELWEIDENFARAELTHAQRADHHVRRRRILIAKGIVHPGPGGPKKGTNLVSYSKEASRALGVHENTVNLDLKRGEKVDPGILREVAGTDLDIGPVLDELAGAPRAKQPALLAEIRARRDEHRLNREHNRVIALTDAEQFAEWISRRADTDAIDTVISWLEGTKPKDVIAALRRCAA
jgi:hypothetical protein